MDEIKNWYSLILDELPSAVKPFFFVSIFLFIVLVIGNSLKLNDSFWYISKEGIFNIAFLLGCYALIFRALNIIPQKLNEEYFLIQYNGSDRIYVFENKDKNRKLWVRNLDTKRFLWGANSKAKEPKDVDEIDFSKYPSGHKRDGEINIKPTWKTSVVLFLSSSIILLAVLYSI